MVLLGVAAAASVARADPAVKFGIAIAPCIGICPSLPALDLPQGLVVPLSVVTLDAKYTKDMTYSGSSGRP